MEVNAFAMAKVLHYLIGKFIESLQEYIESIDVESSKVFLEVLKRRYSISKAIRSIALYVLTNENTDNSLSEDVLDNKIKILLESYVQQDLIECAMLSENVISKFVTEGDLQQSLYSCSLHDEISLSISFTDDLPSSYIGNVQSFQPSSILSSNISKESNSVLFSTHFNQDKMKLKEDIFQLKKEVSKQDLSLVLENGSPFSDVKSSEIYSRLNSEVYGSSRSTYSFDYNDSPQNNHFDEWLLTSSIKQIEDSHTSHGYTWEGRMKQFIPCHLYSSELNEKEVSFNVTSDDPQIFRSLYVSTTSISEDNLKYDILDLIVGIPSSIFPYDDINKKFQINSHVHLDKLSHASTLGFVEKFLHSGTLFRKLQFFSSKYDLNEGLIIKGLKTGLKKVLKVYTEYIMAVKVKKPTFFFLKTDVLEAAESLNILGYVCKIGMEEDAFSALPKGLGLLTYLKEFLWPLRRKENSILSGVILKYSYIPYFKYLEKWMDEGICYDPHGEFQIIENVHYLDRKDELYWKFAYTENFEDPMRIVPSEIKIYASKILQCGKNMRLMKICCPQLYSLEYMVHHPPPSLSILFSYSAAKIKEEMCRNFMENKEKAEIENSQIKDNISHDYILLNNQCLVNRADIAYQNKVRWSDLKNNNIKKSFQEVHRVKKFASLENLTSLYTVNSDVIYENVGILFTLDKDDINRKEFQPSDALDIKFKHSSDGDKDCYLQFSFQKNRNFEFSLGRETNSSQNILKDLNNSDFPSKTESINHACKTVTSENTDSSKGTFMTSLASLLQSDCDDTEQDIYSCLQLSSLQSLMFYSLRPVLNMRMFLIERIIKDFVMNQLKFQELLVCLKNTYLLLDESFSQMLCEKLFPWVFRCHTTHQFANFSILNEIFCSSLSENSCSSFPLLSTGTVIVVDLPENDILERNEFLQFFQFEFKIDWPLNIIIHKICIAQYKKIFTFLLELDFLCYLLGKMWRSLMSYAKSSDIQNSTQFRAIMLNRFDMHQFIGILRNCIRHDFQGPVWDLLVKNLNSKELSIDILEDIHCQYLEKVLNRCFLTKETEVLHELIRVMFRHVYKFGSWTLESKWEFNESSRQYEISEYNDLTSLCETYKKYQKAFYESILRITISRKFGASGNEGFKQYLETILESKRKFLS